MKLIDFSVTNYRSITTANKINLQSLTVLVGKNNEGKSNLLTALNVAMTTILFHCKSRGLLMQQSQFRNIYNWERDFPIQFKNRTKGYESIFKLNFRLEDSELIDFKNETGIRGNEDIPIIIKFGKDNSPKIEVPKRGSSSYNKKSKIIAEFISSRISFNYIQAIRTEKMALDFLKSVIYDELSVLNKNEKYVEALKITTKLQQIVLDGIASKLIEPLRIFLPQIKDVKIEIQSENYLRRIMRNELNVIVDDGTPTNISFKGEGIKSLLTLAILKDKQSIKAASIIAIEEPEAHLHSGAIHSLVNVINRISEKNQVIITTHNPLFIKQNSLKSNILVNDGTARPAKSIAEIRKILGVLPSDNLLSSNHVFVVEGENDKIALTKILCAMSSKISTALNTNSLVIKPLLGASNLSHDLADLKNCICDYFVLLDNDDAGIQASNKAIANGLLDESQIKFTICNGTPKAEFEDCIKTELYKQEVSNKFSVSLNSSSFSGKKKWSEKMKNAFLNQGATWNEDIEKKVKLIVAEAIPDNIENIHDVLIKQKSGFLESVVLALEKMISNTD
ncbi:MAG: AAA family ATPase [Clostridia bacterium]|jgi:predicted ATP-dependent endonuclease of OLD family